MQKYNEVQARSGPSCNVSSTFNFTVGAIAIAVAFAIGYFVLRLVR